MQNTSAQTQTLEKVLMFHGYECLISIWREWKSSRNCKLDFCKHF